MSTDSTDSTDSTGSTGSTGSVGGSIWHGLVAPVVCVAVACGVWRGELAAVGA